MAIVFFLLWLIFNGRITLEIVLTGLVISIFLYVFCRKFLGYKAHKEKKLWRNAVLAVIYILDLIWEIIIANIHVIKLVLSPVIKINPCLTHFQASVKGTGKRVILANSITLTPGTITVDLGEQGYYVHVLDNQPDLDLANSSFVKLLSKMEEN